MQEKGLPSHRDMFAINIIINKSFFIIIPWYKTGKTFIESGISTGSGERDAETTKNNGNWISFHCTDSSSTWSSQC